MKRIKRIVTATTRVRINWSNGRVSRYLKMSPRRLLAICRGRSLEKIALYVSYGKHKNVFGKMVTFTNSGVYENLSDAVHMLRAFQE